MNASRRSGFFPRVGLLTALLFGALFCLVVALLGPKPWLSREEHALERFRKVHARIDLGPGDRCSFVGLDAANGASDEHAALLGDIRDLEGVELCGAAFTDASALELAKLSKLESLSLDDTDIGAAGLAEIAASVPIERFSCSASPSTSVDLLAAVDVLAELRSLAATGDGLTLPEADAIGRLEHLETLNLRLFGPSDSQAFDRLTRLRGLKSLTIEILDVALRKEDLLRFAQFAPLASLTVAKTDAGDAEIVELAKLPNLRALACRAPKATNASVEALSQVETLESLDLLAWNVDDAALDSLQKAPRLRLLTVDESISLAAIERFQRERSDCLVFRVEGMGTTTRRLEPGNSPQATD